MDYNTKLIIPNENIIMKIKNCKELAHRIVSQPSMIALFEYNVSVPYKWYLFTILWLQFVLCMDWQFMK